MNTKCNTWWLRKVSILTGHEICQNTFCLSPALRIYNCLRVIFPATVLWRKAFSCPAVRTTSVFILKMIANKAQGFFFTIPLSACSEWKSYWNKTFKVLPFTVLLGRYFREYRHPDMQPGLKSFICSFRWVKGMTYGKEEATVGRHDWGQGQECKSHNWLLQSNISGRFPSMEHHTRGQDEDRIWDTRSINAELWVL